jgi:tRNA threonylcarbamoyladenosine biosynthesis protein TsaE
MKESTYECDLENEAATERLGAALAEVLPAGTVVALVGTLGAGKTRLVQAVAVALGVPRDAVTSPTFVLVNEYPQGRLPVYHFDTYRLKDDDEFLELGPDEYFESDGITFVEWADRVAGLLPTDRLEITLEVTGETSRRATIGASSSNKSPLVERLAAALGR